MAEGTVIGGRYRLDERIASGAMGAVWRGTDMLLNRTVAIKELLAAAAPSTTAGGRDALEESRQRIHREGRIAARLQHAHVIRMFDVVVYDDRPWLVMEYLESRSLSGVINQEGPLTVVEAAAIGRDVADGLAAAHLAGVVHRDVKPGNVLIAEDGRTKLTDFGVSRAVDDVQITRTGLIAGTPAFLAPEVARGADPAPAADVFALGATIYAAIEGKPPFGLNDNAYALLHKVATGVIEQPTRCGPLTGLVLRLLSKDPDARPTAAQARDELAAFVRSGAPTAAPAVVAEPQAATPPPGETNPPTLTAIAPVPENRPARRRAPVVLAAVAVAVALAGIATAMVVAATAKPVTPGAPAAAAAPVTSVAAPTSTSAPTPTPTPSATTTPTSIAPTTAAAVTGDPVAFVRNYYALLPSNTAAAFNLLSPRAQAASGGRGQFDAFYGGLRAVSLQNARAVGDDIVAATVLFTRADGSTSSESYRFVMGPGPNGSTVMESFSRA